MPVGQVTGPPLVIRADADERIGLGHIGRTIALAEAWRARGGQVRYVATPSLAEAAAGWIARAGAELNVLSVGRYSREDAERTVALAGSAPVVFDGFEPPADYRSMLRAGVRRLTFIDDVGGAGPWVSDVLVNQNYGAGPGLYPTLPAGTATLFGPSFALVRNEFARWRDRRPRPGRRARRLAFSFGGADPKDVATTALAAVDRLNIDDLRVILATGPANPRAGALAGLRRRASVTVLRQPRSMARLLAWADVAVVAGGSTVWEAACLGVPMLGIVVAENQRPGAEALARDGLWRYLGAAEDISPAILARALEGMIADPAELRRLSEAGRSLVDGRGPERIAAAVAG